MEIRTVIKKLVLIACEKSKTYVVYRDVVHRFKADTGIEATEKFDNHFNKKIFLITYIIPFIPPCYLNVFEIKTFLMEDYNEKIEL